MSSERENKKARVRIRASTPGEVLSGKLEKASLAWRMRPADKENEQRPRAINNTDRTPGWAGCATQPKEGRC